MADKTLVHTKRISPTEIRELSVYYDKGGINYFDYSTKPTGIYFSSTVYEHEEGSAWKTLKIGIGQKRPGIGYICAVALDRYRAKALREVRERVMAHTDKIHMLCDRGDTDAVAELKAILAGEQADQAPITVTYLAVDGFTKTETFAKSEHFDTRQKARAFAVHWIGETPEISETYAVSADGVGRITAEGISVSELFSKEAAS